ncbi:hypothetical protein ACLB2K_031334 [Fragaria x ananassa]
MLDATERKEVPNDKVHHLTFVNEGQSESYAHFLLSYKKLRTLTVVGSSKNSISTTFELIQFKNLRTLTLCPQRDSSLEEIPKTIGGLIHLRYLDLSGNNKLKELPSPVGNLYNLQTLQLVGCSSLNKLKHLKDLNRLQGSLNMKIREYPKNMAENAAILVNKAHLLELNLHEVGQRGIMNGLEPHPVLESLYIDFYKGGAFSDWLSYLPSLRVLTLNHGYNCKVLPPLGKLASLESLCIKYLNGVEKVGVEFLGILEGQSSSSSSGIISFPKLKKLSLEGMRSLEEWKGVEEDKSENITIMSCLDELEIVYCEKLKALPDFLWCTPLQDLYIHSSPVLQQPYMHGVVKIPDIPNLDIFH